MGITWLCWVCKTDRYIEFADQLFLNFESLEEKPKRHDWDGDND